MQTCEIVFEKVQQLDDLPTCTVLVLSRVLLIASPSALSNITPDTVWFDWTKGSIYNKNDNRNQSRNK